MSDQDAIPTADAVETFVASLCQRAVPVNTIKSYAHDLRLFTQAAPPDLTVITPEHISRIFGKQLLLHKKSETSAVASAAKKVLLSVSLYR